MLKTLMAQPYVQRAFGVALFLYMRFCAATMRWRVEGREHIAAVKAGGAPGLFCLWHGRLIMAGAIWRAARGKARVKPAIFVSQSRDGRIAAVAAQLEGVVGLAGSTARAGRDKGGFAALAAAYARLNSGGVVGVTPDGPRGPAGAVSPALMTLALQTGAVLLPVAWAARPVWRLKTWDMMCIPIPFSRGAIVALAPLGPPTRAGRGAKALELQQALDEAVARAESLAAVARSDRAVP